MRTRRPDPSRAPETTRSTAGTGTTSSSRRHVALRRDRYGNDDLSAGPGNDEAAGDALVDSYLPGAAPGAGAAGSGNDEINGLLGTDLIVGGAAVHGNGTANCGGGSDKLNGEPNDPSGRTSPV
jgi:hypothetical protein